MSSILDDNNWPLEADFSDNMIKVNPVIRPMTKDERNRARVKEAVNNLKPCISCGNPARDVWCHFCMGEE